MALGMRPSVRPSSSFAASVSKASSLPFDRPNAEPNLRDPINTRWLLTCLVLSATNANINRAAGDQFDSVRELIAGKLAITMLHAFLPGIGGFCSRNGVGHVPGEGKPLLLGFVRDRKVDVARKQVVHLDEVVPLLLGLADGLASVAFRACD